MVLSRVVPQLQAIDGAAVLQQNFQTIEEGNMSSNRSDRVQHQQEPLLDVNREGNPPAAANVFQQQMDLGQLVASPLVAEQQLMSPSFPEYPAPHQQKIQ